MRCTLGLAAALAWGLSACNSAATPAPAATGPASYFLAVITVPSGPSAAGTTDSYELHLPSSPNNALHWARRAAQPAAAPPVSPEWQARMRFEGARRDHMDAVNLRRLAGEEPTHRDTACTAACTGQQMCWQGACTGSPTLTFIDGTTQVACTVAAVVPVASANTAINVLVDVQDATANPNAVTQAVSAATLFASTFSTELQLLGRTGHVPPVDVDGDGRMTMVFTSQNGQAANADDNSNLAGFFSIADVLNPNSSLDGVQADGNQADLLWVRVPGATLGTGTPVTPLLLAGTMAHEYTHLTSFALRVLGATPPLGREELWLDEGMAHTMEDLTGWGPSTVRVIESALNDWTKNSVFASGSDSIDQRGAAYTLVRYLIDQAAKAAGASSAADSATVTAAGTFLGGLIQENALGYAHQAFANLGDAGLFNWLVALEESGSTAGLAAAHAYDYLPTGTNSVSNNIIGFNPRGTYSDSSAQSLSLSGPTTNDLDATSSDPSGALDESGTALYTDTGFDGTKVTQTAQAGPNGPFLHVLQVAGASP